MLSLFWQTELLLLLVKLPLSLEAPVMMPKGVDFLFFSFLLTFSQLWHSLVNQCPEAACGNS